MLKKPSNLSLLLLIVISLFSFFHPSSSFAQNYLPLQDGHLHRFSAPARNYSVRVDSSWSQSGDDYYRLNRVTGPQPPCPPNTNTNPNYWGMGHEGRFGDHFIAKSDGSFHFVSSSSGDTAVFHTQVPLNTPWNFLTNSSITAEITQRAQQSFFNVTDSVLTIRLSTGVEYQLSENHGLYAGNNLSFYFTGDSLQASTLFSLPEVPDWRNMYEAQPGDYWTVRDFSRDNGFNHFYYRVYGRYDAPSGDTIVLNCWRKHVIECGPNDYKVTIDSMDLSYIKSDHLVYERASDEAVIHGDSSLHVTRDFYRNSSFNDRLSIARDVQSIDGCGNAGGYLLAYEFVFENEYMVGLGFSKFEGFTPNWSEWTYRIGCYSLGNDFAGPCDPMLTALSEEKDFSGDMSVFQSGEEVFLRWEAMAAGDYNVSVWDLQGRRIWEADWSMQDSGEKTINTQLSNGVWLLRVQSQDGQRSLAKKFAVIR